MALLIFYLVLALTVSFLCSIMEAVLLSTPRSFLMVKQEKKLSWADTFLSFKNDIDKPLSAILSLNTIAHTIGAAGVGAQVVNVYGEAYFGIASAILTVLILFITEIVPKTLGARYWRKFAYTSTYLISGTMFITYPLVIVSSFLTRAISKDKKQSITSREEITAMASIGADEGIFSEKEYSIIHNLLRLKKVKVTEIMTPRVVVAIADERLYLNEFLQNKDYLKFSRIPVYSENDENITGYVFRQTVFEKLAEDQHELRLKDLKRKIVFMPEQIELFTAWETLLKNKEHIAVIVDEYGGMDGIITMEDIIETILGLEIVDETDTITDMQKYARERWQKRQDEQNRIINNEF